MFPDLDYLDWIQGRPEVAMYDLGTSDLRGEHDQETRVVPPALDGLADPPAGATLEMQLAGAYGVEPDQVLVTPGASTANFIAFAAAHEADPENAHALVEKPGYEPLVKTPAGVGFGVDRFRRADDASLDTGRIEKAMTPDTALVTITNRHNPSGRLTDRETLAEAAAIAREGDARLLVDEVYAPFTRDAGDGAFGGVTAADLDGTVVTGSLTKFWGLGDLRIGWVVADADFVDRARKVSHHVPGVAGPSRALAMRALHNLDHLTGRSRDLLDANSDLLAEFVATRDDVEGFVAPDSTFAFLNPVHADGDEVTAKAWERGLLVVPGRFFGESDRIRVSLGLAPNQMASALRELGDVLDSLDES
ncbi:pyridoxal phosphate-dependent aminotransferase [Halocalculus aciditolerans]|uniref:Aminotransferase class I/classII large domain-containing protein n=1 Tax=Halocalculus aciditolerans TaxID=1383812 RepID=A0A830FI31_9EURY|nr:pyridoxal phosphate-dependent aminotransferase [Halocalculus aciditolerans]GGL57304.1 hypothetical protein GCM10009039_14350 [Halocalculus aciditolerans]